MKLPSDTPTRMGRTMGSSRIDMSTAMNAEAVTNIDGDADVDRLIAMLSYLKDGLPTHLYQEILSHAIAAMHTVRSRQPGPAMLRSQQFVKAREKTAGDSSSGSADKKDKETPMEKDK